MVLYAEPALERLLVLDFGYELAVYKGLDVRALADHSKLVPLLWLEKSL